MEIKNNLRKLLKQNAPQIFKKWAKKKIFSLESELKKLREEYRKESNQKIKEEIRKKGEQVKMEIEEIKSLLEKNEKTKL